MATSLHGKFIAVTGSTQGLGEEVARRAAAAGAAGIVLSGRSRERGERVAAACGSADCRTVFVQAELQDPDACRLIVDAADRTFGRLDGLVNAAACTERGTLEDTSVQHWDKFMAINLRAPFVLMQGAARIMQREGRGGSIVNILSMSAHGGTPNLTPYSVSKGALGTLTRNAAHSQRTHRIRVNALNIGWMSTPAEHDVQMREGAAGQLARDCGCDGSFRPHPAPERRGKHDRVLAQRPSGNDDRGADRPRPARHGHLRSLRSMPPGVPDCQPADTAEIDWIRSARKAPDSRCYSEKRTFEVGDASRQARAFGSGRVAQLVEQVTLNH